MNGVNQAIYLMVNPWRFPVTLCIFSGQLQSLPVKGQVVVRQASSSLPMVEFLTASEVLLLLLGKLPQSLTTEQGISNTAYLFR